MLMSVAAVVAAGSAGETVGQSDLADAPKCLALSMRAGGMKGMYQVGVLQSLYDNLEKGEMEYDVVTGASIGSVNAALVAMYAKGNETVAIEQLYQEWAHTNTSNVFVQWPVFGPLAGLWKPSFLDNTPSHTRINAKLKEYPL